MPQYTEKMTDRALVVELMAEELLAQYEADGDRRDELSAELERRHVGANERLAQHVTGHRMTSTEAVVWAGAHWESCERIVVGPPSVGAAWVVVEQVDGHIAMRPCSVDEAHNAIGSVVPDQLVTAWSIGEAFWKAETYHPGEGIAAYIVDNSDGTYTVAV